MTTPGVTGGRQLRILCFLTIFSSLVSAQFPSACVENIVTDRQCCPQSCGGPERGSCQTVEYRYEGPGDREGDPDRLNWPTAFYDRVCKCKGNFWGYNCMECRPGYRGDKCAEHYVLKRKNLATLTDEELATFHRLLNVAYNTTSEYKVMTRLREDLTLENINESFTEVSVYHAVAWMHYYTARRNLNGADIFNKNDFAHEGPIFNIWHRYYLLVLEHELRKLQLADEDFALPYWNWIGETNECSVCVDQLMGSSSSAPDYTVRGAFEGWQAICIGFAEDHLNGTLCRPDENLRDLKRFPGDPQAENRLFHIPTCQEVALTLSETTYDRQPANYNASENNWMKSDCSFRGLLEGYTASSEHYADCPPGLGCGLEPNGGVGVNDLHNRVHLFLGGAEEFLTVGGTMGSVETSAMDPIFFMHHGNVDRLFEIWINRNNGEFSYPSENVPIGHHLFANMVPFYPITSVEEILFKKSEELGYTYDDLEDDFEKQALPICSLNNEIGSSTEYPTNPPGDPENDEFLEVWEISLIAVGSSIFGAVLMALLCLCYNRKKNSKVRQLDDSFEQDNPAMMKSMEQNQIKT